MAPQRTLTRNEAKALTRGRILEAATVLLAKTGYAGLSASAVAREAGIAQPTFYVHFRDKADLVRTLSAEHVGALRARVRAARERVLEGEGVTAVRETFRIPLEIWVAHPELLRLQYQESRRPASPLGEALRALRDEMAADLVEDLARLGLPNRTKVERERLDMIVEAIFAQTEALALAYVDGRYTSLDDVVEVLTAFTLGVLPLAARVPNDR